jgi:transcriptional regulator with XRE-family HTH domain
VNVPPGKPADDWTPKRRDPEQLRAVGANIKSARIAADLSQAELGKKLQTRKGTPVEKAQISSYERGRNLPEGRLWGPLAEALGVPEEVLFAPVIPGGKPKTLAGRLARVESELETLRQRFEDHLDAQAAELYAAEADRADRASKKAAGRSRERRPSKGDRG